MIDKQHLLSGGPDSSAIDLLVQLVKAQSEPDSEKDSVLNVVIPHLEKMGLTIHRHENNGNPAIFATRGSPTILFNGHLDTVPKGTGWSFENGQVVGSRIYGRGSLDMKGGCISLLLAAEILTEKDIDFAIIYTTDEEVGMAGANEVARQHPEISKIPLFVICEPTDLCPVVDEKGIVQFRITTTGKNAHASMPELGRNAIADLVVRLNKLIESELYGKSQHDPVTIGINIISGGMGLNVMPDIASADVDVRFPATYSNDEMFGILKKIVRADDQFVEVELLHELPPVKSAISDEMLARIEKLTGGKSYKVSYGTEMAVFGRLNNNILVLGPGGPTMAHQTDEWIDINDVVRAVEVYVELAELL
ncbi:MAG: M20/M25/M40 family metallo-hydrolase [Thermoplasmata archaeon]|nr:M20/M25/M40 family metallo-hydrolase [Thermoplasmata archaeon]